MSFYRGFLLCCGLLIGLSAGCGGVTTDTPTDLAPEEDLSAQTDSVMTLLQTADTAALREAFEARTQTNYFRRSRTRQIDPATNEFVASYDALVEHLPGESDSIRPVETDSSGSFRLGFLSSFMSPPVQLGMLGDPVPHLLPDDPAYLGSRGPSLYRYELLPDTVIAGRSTAVARISLKPSSGDEQEIRRGRFYIDRSTMELVGMMLQRQQNALLFSEESTLEVHIQRLGSAGWFPDRTSYQTRLDIPFIASKFLTTEARYFTQFPGG